MATATAKTTGAALRQKLFSAGPATAGGAIGATRPGSEALKQATDSLLRQKSQQDATLTIYRAKLTEAQSQVKKLEEAYMAQAHQNSRLQTTVTKDHEQLVRLIDSIKAQKAALEGLATANQQLAGDVAAAEAARRQLEGAYRERLAVCNELSAKVEAACQHGAELQSRLDAAHEAHSAQAEDIVRLQREAEHREAEAAEALQTQAQRLQEQQERAAALEAQLGTASGELEALQRSAAEAERAHGAAAGDLQRLLEAKTVELGEAAAQLEATEASMREEGAKAAEQLTAKVEATVKEVEQSLADATAAVEALNINAKAVEEAHAEEVAKAQAVLEELQAATAAQLAQATSQLKAKAQELAALAEEKVAVEAALKESQGLLAELAAEHAALKEAASNTEAGLATQLQDGAAEHQRQLEKVRAGLTADHERQLERAAQAMEDVRKKARGEAEQMQGRLAELERAAKEAAEKFGEERTTFKSQLAQAQGLVASKEAAYAKLDRQNGEALHKLDMQVQALDRQQRKLEAAEADIVACRDVIQAKDEELSTVHQGLRELQEKHSKLSKEVHEKNHILGGLAQIATFGAAQGSQPAAAGKPQAGGKKVAFVEPEDEEQEHEANDGAAGWEEEEEEQLEVANPESAVVVATGSQGRGQLRPGSQPIITEPEEDSDAEPARGRKRSGRSTGFAKLAPQMQKKAKTKAQPAGSGGRRGMFSMGTASQGGSRNNKATAASGVRKPALGLTKTKKKAQSSGGAVPMGGLLSAVFGADMFGMNGAFAPPGDSP